MEAPLAESFAMNRILTGILVGVALCACAASSWTKVGASADDLERDSGICKRYARAVAEGQPDRELASPIRGGEPRRSREAYSATLRRCMQDRGWAEDLESGSEGVREYTQDEVLALIAEGGESGPLLLDVRTVAEYASAHVPGAVNIPHDELPDRSAEIAAFRERGVITYCESGRRAGIAAESLEAAGFREIGHLQGDMSAWRGRGLPTE